MLTCLNPLSAQTTASLIMGKAVRTEPAGMGKKGFIAGLEMEQFCAALDQDDSKTKLLLRPSQLREAGNRRNKTRYAVLCKRVVHFIHHCQRAGAKTLSVSSSSLSAAVYNIKYCNPHTPLASALLPSISLPLFFSPF